MKVLFDISSLLNSHGGGIYYHLKGLLPELLQRVCENESELEFLNLYFRKKPLSVPEWIKESTLHQFRFPVKLLNALWLNFNFPDFNRFYHDVDIVHSPHFSLPVFKSAKKILTVHDITYLRHPEFFDPKYKKLNDYGYKQLLPENLKRANHIITISDFTKNDLVDFFDINPEKITTIYTGVDVPEKVDLNSSNEYLKQNNLLAEQYIYFPVGTFEPRKNIELTIKAFEKSNTPNHVKLLLSGVGKIDWLGDVKNNDNVQFLEWHSIRERNILYQNANFIVYPSLYEGFGMPVVESMSYGKAALTSNTTSLGEIAHDFAYTVDPQSLDELINGFNMLLNDEQRANFERKSQQQRECFSWNKMAEETFKVYEKVLGE